MVQHYNNLSLVDVMCEVEGTLLGEGHGFAWHLTRFLTVLLDYFFSYAHADASSFFITLKCIEIFP